MACGGGADATTPNNGEASNTLRHAVFIHRWREVCDRSFEYLSLDLSGRVMIRAAMLRWNAVSLDRVVKQRQAQSAAVRDDPLARVARLGRARIGLSPDYIRSRAAPARGSRSDTEFVPRSDDTSLRFCRDRPVIL